VAVGDGENDLSLLAEAGLAVAMGNAAPALLRAADRVMPSNNEDGAALILEELAYEALASR
jgi:hydroxymethylpyrimidine pyrophosphatase-like HAD family hydrolase